MHETIVASGIEVVNNSSLYGIVKFKRKHEKERVLLVRSPIPNEAEKPILAYLEHGFVWGYLTLFIDRIQLRECLDELHGNLIYLKNKISIIFNH